MKYFISVFICLFILSFLSYDVSSLSSWKSGNPSIEVTAHQFYDTNNTLTVKTLLTASRSVSSGSFSFSLTFNRNVGITEEISECIPFHASISTITSSLNSMRMIQDVGNVKDVLKFGNGLQDWEYGYELHMIFESNMTTSSFSSFSLDDMIFSIDYKDGDGLDCSEILTEGYWNDPTNWESEQVPTTDLDIYFPSDSGIIILDAATSSSSDDDDSIISIDSLTMKGGVLKTHESNCESSSSSDDENWIPSPTYSKCLRWFNTPKNFFEAESLCASQAGAFQKVAQISSLEENNKMRDMCQDRGRDLGCWIGLTDGTVAQGTFLWSRPEDLVSTTFRSWAQFEPDNQTTLTGGEDCVFIGPQLRDPQSASQVLFFSFLLELTE